MARPSYQIKAIRNLTVTPLGGKGREGKGRKEGKGGREGRKGKGRKGGK